MPLLGSQPGSAAAPALHDAPTPKAALAGTLIILVVLALRVLVAYDPTPGWSGDPLEMESPIVSLTPMGSLFLDALTFAGSAMILFSTRRAPGGAPPIWQTLCLAAGAVATALHARVLRNASMENLTLGSSWLAAFAAAFAATRAARDQRLRALIAAALLGLIAPLTVKGLVQYFIEQPDSVKMFLENKARVLSANGWTEGSPMARAYWERLRQREATAWFGLANVFATLAAATFTALAGLTLAALRDRQIPARAQALAFLMVGAAIAAAGVVLAGSKGGYAAAALGLALVALTHLWPRCTAPPKGPATGGAGASPAQPVERERISSAPQGAGAIPDGASTKLGPLLAVFLPALALLAIAVRGLLADRLHELSLLFRWFYIQTAAKIFAQHPLLGTGPDAFKPAYMLLKPAIAPEDVSSPHSIFFDLAARLGLAGLALSALLIAWLWQAGRATFAVSDPSPSAPHRGVAGARIPPRPAREEPPDRTNARLLLIVIAIATAAAALIEQQTATVASTVARAAGLAGFLLIAVATLRLFATTSSSCLATSALAAAAIAAFTHCQIELTGVTPGANFWVFLLIAVGAGAGATLRLRAVPELSPPTRHNLRAIAAALLPLATLALLVPFALIPATRWELLLRSAYSRVELIPSLAARAEAVAAGKPLVGDTPDKLAKDLREFLQGPPARRAQSIIVALRLTAVPAAHNDLAAAAAIPPPDFETIQALVHLKLQLAAVYASLSPPDLASATAASADAESTAAAYVASTPARPNVLAWLGLLRRSRYELDHDSAHLKAAVEAWGQAAVLAPHDPLYQLQLARTCAMLGNREAAAGWALHALQANRDLELDPIRQFSKPELDELTAIVEGAQKPPPHPPDAP